MASITWKPVMSVKIKQFDDQHKRLVGLVNELNDAMKAGKGTEVLGTVLRSLIIYTVEHFADEERLMVAHDYPDRIAHTSEHERLVRQVQDLQQKFDSGQPIQTFDVMMFLKDWLMNHIQVDDKKYGVYLVSRGVQ